MQQVAAVEADRLVAPEVARPEAARRAAQQEFAGGRLVVILVGARGRAGGDEQRREQLALLVEVEPLGHLVHDDAVFLIRRDGFEPPGTHPAGFQLVAVVIGLDQRPAVLLVEHAHGDRFAVEEAPVRVRRLARAVRPVGEVDLLVAADVEHGDIRRQPRPGGLLVERIKLSKPRGRDSLLRVLNHLCGRRLRLGLRGDLRGERARRRIGLERLKRRGIGLARLRQALVLLIGHRRGSRRLAEFAGAVAVVIAQLLEPLLKGDDRLAGRARLERRADQALPQNAVAADGRVVELVAVSRDDARRRAEDVIVALDGMDGVAAVRLLRHEFDDAHVVKPVVLVPLDVDQVARLGHIGPVRDAHAVAQVKLLPRVFERTAHGDIAPLLREPGRALVAGGLHGIRLAQHRQTIDLIRATDAPGDKLRAPLAVGAAAPLAVFAVAALRRGIAQLADSHRQQSIRPLVGSGARARRQQQKGEQQSQPSFHEHPPEIVCFNTVFGARRRMLHVIRRWAAPFSSRPAGNDRRPPVPIAPRKTRARALLARAAAR